MDHLEVVSDLDGLSASQLAELETYYKELQALATSGLEGLAEYAATQRSTGSYEAQEDSSNATSS